MLDPKFMRQHFDEVVANAKRRGTELDPTVYEDLEKRRHELQQKTQELQAQRNKTSKAIGMAKAKGEDIEPILAEVADIGDELKLHETALHEVKVELDDFVLRIPNMLHASVPEGKDEKNNKLMHSWGEPTQFDFTVKEHDELGEALGLIDFDAASKLSGSRFVVLRGGLARMQRALAQFMLDLHIEQHGYEEVYTPYLVKSDALIGTGQLPKFKDDQFTIAGEWDLTLIPTSEVTLANLAREKIIPADQLPLKLVTQTPCFRSEAGSYGKDVRGMIRQHQFQKVELVQMVRPQDSDQAQEEILQHAEKVLQLLELPYRVMLLCSGDVGFSAVKTYDLEVWMPGQNVYREISSVSNCEDFQARRMQARWRNPETNKPELLHTLNGSGLAVGRALIAVMENYQDSEGRIHVPLALQPYMGGQKLIG